MTYAEQESMEYKATIKNDFDKGYDDASSGKVNKGTSDQYKEGYKVGSRFKGK